MDMAEGALRMNYETFQSCFGKGGVVDLRLPGCAGCYANPERTVIAAAAARELTPSLL